MHKDISGVLTVSTCLLNHDRNSVSDFQETPHHRRRRPSSPSHMCPSLLNGASPGRDSPADNLHSEKKEHVFKDVNQRR